MNNDCFPNNLMYQESYRFSQSKLSFSDAKNFCFKKWNHISEFGVFRMPVKSNFGLSSSSGEICDVWEGLGAGSNDNGILFSAGAHLWAVIKPISEFGTDEQKSQWLPKLLDGTYIGAHAASEAEAGSDVMSLRTSYSQVDGGFVLNGLKLWVTNSPIADLFLVFATCDPKLHYRGISAFLVPRSAHGITIGITEKKSGLQSSPMASIAFQNCFVDHRSLLGEEMQGAKIFNYSLAWERTFILSPMVGTMRRQIISLVDFCKKRKQFGHSIGKFQAVSSRVADAYTKYWMARQLLRKSAFELVNNDNFFLSPTAKKTISQLATEINLDVLKTYGSIGYMKESAVCHDILDALGSFTYSGTSDIQRNIIATNLGL